MCLVAKRLLLIGSSIVIGYCAVSATWIFKGQSHPRLKIIGDSEVLNYGTESKLLLCPLLTGVYPVPFTIEAIDDFHDCTTELAATFDLG